MSDPQTAPDLQVFVYGTLKPGQKYWQQICEGRVHTAMPARVRGQLVALDLGYPALLDPLAVPSPSEPGWVHGYILTLPDPEILREIDALEDFDPFRPPQANDYNRAAILCYDPTGQPFTQAWTYFMHPERAQAYGTRPLAKGTWNGPTW